MRELTVAVRRLRHNPSFFFAAVITLAVGVAASTALFAVVNATLLRPLPYPRAQDIYAVRTTMTDGRFTIGLVASEEMSELRRATDAIGASALVQRRDDTLLTETSAQQVTSFGVSEEFFELFAVPMAAGRAFVADDFAAAQRSRVILSTKSWRTLFGASPDVVGRTIRFAGGSALVVGVAGAAFDVPRDADLWFAQHNQDSIGHAFDAFVRFKPGRTPESISAAMPAMWNGLAKKYPDQARNRVFVMRPLLDAMVGDLRPVVLIAFAATGLLLLLAIVNVANLMLARGRARAREMAVRTALGATRWGIMRPLLTESLLIADRGHGRGDSPGRGGDSRDCLDGRSSLSAGRWHRARPDGLSLFRVGDDCRRHSRRPCAGIGCSEGQPDRSRERRRPRRIAGPRDAPRSRRDDCRRSDACDRPRRRCRPPAPQHAAPAGHRSWVLCARSSGHRCSAAPGPVRRSRTHGSMVG